MITLDADLLPVTEINRQLRAAINAEQTVEILNPRAKHHLGVGILGDLDIIIRGSAGYFCGCLNEDLKLQVDGSVGWYAADNLMSGEMIIHGQASSCAAPGMCGGRLVIKRNAGSRLGQIMKGGTIIVGGNCGFMTGFMMLGGTIIVAGDVGDLLGHYMVGGTIYVGGKVESLGVDAREVDYQPGDDAYLKELLPGYGISAPLGWRKFISGQKHHHYGKWVNEHE